MKNAGARIWGESIHLVSISIFFTRILQFYFTSLPALLKSLQQRDVTMHTSLTCWFAVNPLVGGLDTGITSPNNINYT